MRVRWTRGARADLKKIVREIAKDRPDTARRVAERVRSLTEDLVSHPLVGKVVEEFGSENVRERVLRPWRIVYRVLPDEVHVLAVVHARQTLDRRRARMRDDDLRRTCP